MARIADITTKTDPEGIIEDLKKKTIEVPSWSELKKAYDPNQHPVMTDENYKDVTKKGVTEKVTRIIFDLQRLAANRMAQLTFGIPVKRIYKPQDENEKRASQILEKIMMKNRIDSVNMERAVMLFAGCEMATLWYAVDGANNYYGEPSQIKIRCKTYSPMDTKNISTLNVAELYPVFDEFDDMVAMCFSYSRKRGDDTIKYFDIYTDEEHVRYVDDGGWKEDDEGEVIEIEKIPITYGYRPSPIWEDTSSNVYEMEWTMSRNGNYLRKNMKPIFGVFTDDKIKFGQEKSENSEFRSVNQYPKDARFEYATWQQAVDSLKYHMQELKQTYFTQLQLPDLSYENMKSAPMSGEALKMMFIDAELKVAQESGRLLEFFDREMSVVKALAKKAFPGLANAFDSLYVEHQITPYKINDETTRINNLSSATGGKQIMSQETAVRELGYVENVEEEMDRLRKETESSVFEPFA